MIIRSWSVLICFRQALENDRKCIVRVPPAPHVTLSIRHCLAIWISIL